MKNLESKEQMAADDTWRRLTHLAVLVQLAAEGDGEVGRRARGVVAAEEIFTVVEGAASALAYVHVLEARLHTATQLEQEFHLGGGRRWEGLMTHLWRDHVLHLLRAVREVQQVCHGDKGVVQSLHGRDALVGVQRQHLLQQVYELAPVGLLRQDVGPLQGGHVDLERE